jgi:hypothetical protein
MSGNLSEETMKWIADQGVDVLDEEDLWKFLEELFKKEWKLANKLKEKGENLEEFLKKYKIFDVKNLKKRWKWLIINLSEIDRLLRDSFGYGNR